MKVGIGLYRLKVAALAGLTVCIASCGEPGDEPGFSGVGGDGGGIVQPTGNPSTVPPATPGGGTQGGVTAPVADAGTGTTNPGPGTGTTTPPADAGTGTTTPPTGGNGALWCNARAVLQTRCQTCHGTEVAGAPMSLVTWEDTQKNSVLDKTKKVSDLIKSRIHDAARPMPPVAQGKLTAAELAALDAWINGGYPNGTCTTPEVPTKPTDEFQWPAECTPDRIFAVKAGQNGQPYPVPANWESNVSINVPVPWIGKVSGNAQAIAIKPLTNNKRVVHHWIMYAGTSQFITSWSPGKPAEKFPDDVGVYMPTSGSFRLNMHYYNKGNNSAEKDESGAEICLGTKARPKTATTNMFGKIALSVPPGKSSQTAVCTHSGSGDVTLITSSPHMHKTGVGAKFEIIHAGGQTEVLDDTPFNQEDQTVKAINSVLKRGDQVRTTCIYNNTTNATKTFGESTDDEMCFNFSRYYPMGALTCFGL
jgi:cytochrome c5